jgi:hypothetical protein
MRLVWWTSFCLKIYGEASSGFHEVMFRQDEQLEYTQPKWSTKVWQGLTLRILTAQPVALLKLVIQLCQPNTWSDFWVGWVLPCSHASYHSQASFQSASHQPTSPRAPDPRMFRPQSHSACSCWQLSFFSCLPLLFDLILKSLRLADYPRLDLLSTSAVDSCLFSFELRRCSV